MQRLLILLAALLLPSAAFADSTVHGLGTNTTNPLPALSCVYVDQGPGTDTKLCSAWAAAFGALTAASNLSDLPNAGTARTNLGLGALATVTPGAGIATWLATPSGANLATALTSALPVSKGGTALTTWTAAAIPLGNGTSAPTFLSEVDGDCVVGAAGAWTAATCLGGGSVSVTAATPNVVINPSPGTGTFTVGLTNPQNTPADGGSHTYTLLSADIGKEVIFANTYTGFVAPQATTTFGAGVEIAAVTKSAVTATATTSTINGIAGSTGILLGANQYTLWDSDGTNWLTALGLPQPATQTGTTFLRDDMTWTTPAGAGNVTAAGTLTAHAPVLGAGSKATVTTAAMTNGQLLVGATGADAAPQTLSQDCTLTSAGVMTCLKTNNVSFTALSTTAPGTGVATALGVNVGSAGAFVVLGGAGGTPSSLTLTNATGLPAASVLAGALANSMTATTQSAASNDTKVATDAYVDAKQFTASVGWIATVNPTGALVFVAPAALTIKSIVGNVEIASGGTSTVSMFKAPTGTACGSGTIQHSGSFNANGTAATNQTLTLVGGAGNVLAAGDRICITTTGTTGWTTGTGVGGLTVAYTVP